MSIIKLLPQKEFEIDFNGQIIKGKFSLWAAKRYCDKRKFTLMQFEQQVQADKVEFEDVCQVILCAVEDVSRREKKGFAYTDQDVCDWIELMGGMYSEDYVNLMRHSNSELPVDEPKTDEEKKSP